MQRCECVNMLFLDMQNMSTSNMPYVPPNHERNTGNWQQVCYFRFSHYVCADYAQ